MDGQSCSIQRFQALGSAAATIEMEISQSTASDLEVKEVKMEKVLGIRSADVTTVRIFASIKAVVVAASPGVLGVGGDQSA
jgi:hypothetical protein